MLWFLSLLNITIDKYIVSRDYSAAWILNYEQMTSYWNQDINKLSLDMTFQDSGTEKEVEH